MENILSELRKLTGKSSIVLLPSGDDAIWEALKAVKKKKVLIQDQGGWLSYKKFPKKLDMEIIEIKTDYGIIDLKDLENKADENSVLLINSMPGYVALENMEKIGNICKKKNTIIINDATGTIGTELAKIGDIIVGSCGKWKVINAHYGGFFADGFSVKHDFDEKNIEKLYEKIKNIKNRRDFVEDECKKVKEDLKHLDIIHKNHKGLVVIVKYKDEDEKNSIIEYCERNNYEFTECPRYIRVNEKAISIEVKRIEKTL